MRPGAARLLGWLGALVLLVGLLPLILPAAGAGLAWLGGCPVGAVDAIAPCHVAGVEVTGYLRAVALLPWLFVLSAPLVVLGAAIVALAGLIVLVRWARSGR